MWARMAGKLMRLARADWEARLAVREESSGWPLGQLVGLSSPWEALLLSSAPGYLWQFVKEPRTLQAV